MIYNSENEWATVNVPTSVASRLECEAKEQVTENTHTIVFHLHMVETCDLELYIVYAHKYRK